jgi:PAS domain S-box-containing protein
MTPPPPAASNPPAGITLAAGDALADRMWAMTHDLLAVAGADRRLTWTNPAWQPLLGWTPDELRADSFHRIVHPDDLDTVARFERDLLAGRAGERPTTELRLRARDGSYRWLMFSARYSPADELVFFCGKDITERKHGEEELRAAEERFRAVTASTRDGIVSADGTGRIIYWNSGAEAIFGRTAAETISRPLTELMPERYRDAHRAGIARFLETGEGRLTGSTVEVEGVRADGSEFPIELSLGSWTRDGQTCFTAVVRDMTDRVQARHALREAEERFAGAFEGAAVGLMLAAPDGTVLRANRALCELTGWPEEELVGRAYEELLHPDERGADDAVIAAMLSGRTQRLATERRFLVADGGTRFVRINLSLIRTPADEPLHFVGQIEDVTERRRMIEALTISEARYKGLIAHLPDSTVHLFDHDLRLLLSEGDRMLDHGYDPQMLEGQLLEDVVPPEAYARLAPEYRAAFLLREYHGLEYGEIARALDIEEIREEALTSFEGALIASPEKGRGSILVNKRSSSQRRRYTVGHELGHFLNPWHKPTTGDQFECTRSDMLVTSGTNRHLRQEVEANRFAIELLAPARRLRAYLSGAADLERVLALALFFPCFAGIGTSRPVRR